MKIHSAVDVPPGWRATVSSVHGRGPCAYGALALIGLRRGELTGMRWKTNDLDAGRIPVVERIRDRVTG